MRKRRRTTEGRIIPYDVIERRIFSKLPATKVSAITILSKTFRNAWSFCQDVILDSRFAKRMPSEEKYKAIVNDILYGYSGEGGRRFHLYFNLTGNEEVAKSWVDKIVAFGFQEMSIDFSPSTRAPIIVCKGVPWSSNVTSLNLKRCDPNFSVAAHSNALPNLLDLTLEGITILQQVMDGVFAACMSLESLKFIDCEVQEDDDLKFRAQSLKGLREIVFQQDNDYPGAKQLDSVFINGPPCLNRIRFSINCSHAVLVMAPPLLGDATLIRTYTRLCEWVDSVT